MPQLSLFNILKGAQNIELCCLFLSLNRNRKKNAKRFCILKYLEDAPLYNLPEHTNAGKLWIKDSHLSLTPGLTIQSEPSRHLNKHTKEN